MRVKYSFDTSALIEGWVRYYPIGTFPGLWTKLENLIDEGHAKAIEEVLVEIKRQDDSLLTWVKSQENLFVKIDNTIQSAVSGILQSYPKLVQSGGSRSGGDPFVIALAQVHKCAVVTAEKRSGNPTDKPKIPDVCEAVGLKCMTLLDLIQEQRWTFS